jgi:hypothetical protein
MEKTARLGAANRAEDFISVAKGSARQKKRRGKPQA